MTLTSTSQPAEILIRLEAGPDGTPAIAGAHVKYCITTTDQATGAVVGTAYSQAQPLALAEAEGGDGGDPLPWLGTVMEAAHAAALAGLQTAQAALAAAEAARDQAIAERDALANALAAHDGNKEA